MELGESSKAANELKRALHIENLDPTEEVDLYFELGKIYENLNDPSEAKYYYRKVLKRDENYRGIKEILDRIN